MKPRPIVLLSFGLQRLCGGFEDYLALNAPLLLRRGDGTDECDAASVGKDLVRRLTARVEFPVTGWVLVRRVQDRFLEEPTIHLSVGV